MRKSNALKRILRPEVLVALFRLIQVEKVFRNSVHKLGYRGREEEGWGEQGGRGECCVFGERELRERARWRERERERARERARMEERGGRGQDCLASINHIIAELVDLLRRFQVGDVGNAHNQHWSTTATVSVFATRFQDKWFSDAATYIPITFPSAMLNAPWSDFVEHLRDSDLHERLVVETWDCRDDVLLRAPG